MTVAEDAAVDKMQFGRWLGAKIASNGVKVTKIANSYFNTLALVQAGESIDRTAVMARLDGQPMSALEMLMVEILLDVAGFKTAIDAHTDYQLYLKLDI
jgi:hypothetical protein